MKSFIYIFSVVLVFVCFGFQLVSGQEIKPGNTNEIKSEMTLNSVNPPIITGSVEKLSPKLDSILSKNAKLEIIAEGFVWSEGPLWLPKQNKLLFSDIPRNSIFQWSEQDGLSLYLDSAGYVGPTTGNDDLVGSNALLLNPKGNLVLCQHGNRQMARMNATLDKPASNYITLVDKYKGKKLNSPNDGVFSKKGDLFFTDPPYGLPGQGDGPSKELTFQGVYKLSASGDLTLIDDRLNRPNGIGLSPDEKTLYVSNSDPENPVWTAYTLTENGNVVNKRLFFDATEFAKKRPNLGLPDGLKIDNKGNLFATGPGGVYIISPNAELLGFINTGHANGNCAFNADKSILYITADMYLMRINLK